MPLYYKGKSGNFCKVESFKAHGEDQVLVNTGGGFEFFVAESYFKANLEKKLPVNDERQAELDQFVESLPE